MKFTKLIKAEKDFHQDDSILDKVDHLIYSLQVLKSHIIDLNNPHDPVFEVGVKELQKEIDTLLAHK